MTRWGDLASDLELWPDGPAAVLGAAAGRALAARRELERPQTPVAPTQPGRHRSPARRTLDLESVAERLVEQLPAGTFPGLVVGSPHGAAVHLALALGVPWLPTSVEVPTPELDGGQGPVGWLAGAERLAQHILAANDGISVRQVYDPVWRGWSGSAFAYSVIRWRRLPSAYQRVIATRLHASAQVVVVRDVSRRLVVPGDGGYSFQLGSRASGLAPGEYDTHQEALGHDLPPRQDADGECAVDRGFVEDLRRYGAAHGRPARQVLYRHPDVLSAAVADLYRAWLRHGQRSGDRLVVECGRLVEPWQVLRAGLVPYWCEHPLRSVVHALEWWLAGSEPFASITVLPEPPGMPLPAAAQLAEWAGVASFATSHGAVDRRCTRAYPLGTVPPHHAAAALRGHPNDLPCLPHVDIDSALQTMARSAQTDGLLVL